MYRLLSLLRLAELIADDSDRAALGEFHNHRSVFKWQGQSLRLVELLDKLQQSERAWEWCGRDSAILDKVYDLTLSKFSHLPSDQDEKAISEEISGGPVKKEQPDCRYYFKAFVTYATKRINSNVKTSELDQEMQSAKFLQNLVMRHFYLSCLECQRRAQDLVSRYTWEVNGQTLSVWMPTYLTAHQRRQWLKANIDDADSSRPLERERIQAIVNRCLMLRRLVPLDEVHLRDRNVAAEPSLSFSVLHDISVQGLAEVVADEKADNIEAQRRSIRSLGKRKLSQMIRQIFEDISCEDYDEKRIAARFGLSTATFSRFAGRRWYKETGHQQRYSIPDLWLNIAQTLAGHAAFVEAARAAGIWTQVEKIAKRNYSTLRSEISHGQ